MGQRNMTTHKFCLLGVLVLCASCAGVPPAASSDAWRKGELNLNQLDENGLRGPSNGKVSVAYEFCIPNRERCKAEVKAIDRTVQFMPGSPGRIGAGRNECLCIGATNKDYRDVLRRLAELPYVNRIFECHFE